MGKTFINLSKKAIALSLVLVLLFNTGGESFASLINTPLIGQEELLLEIREALENAKTEDDTETKNYKACVESKSEEKCKVYVNGIKERLQKTATQVETPTTEDKQSYKAFETAYKKAIEKEYKKGEEEIRKNILSGWLFSELTWENMNRLNYLESQSKEELLNWKKSEEKKIKGLYAKYEKDYNAWKAKVEKEEEEAGRTYLKEVSKRLIQTYNTTQDNSLKREIRKIIVALLNSEEKAGDFVEWRTSAETILIDGLANKPCDFNSGGKKLTQEAASRYIGYDKPGVYPEIKAEDWVIIPASYKDEARCQEAFIALDGLSHLSRSDKGITAVRTFMRENHQGLAAADSLIEGMAVLLKWKAYNNINSYIASEMKTENEGKGNSFGGFGAISEEIAYNGNYLGSVSSFTQRPDGTNAWEDLAQLLAEEGSEDSQKILRTSVNSCKVVHALIGSDKLECTTILPFLYGALLHAPKTMDTAKPYQEPIPVGKEYLDAQGRIHPTNRDRVIQENQWRVKDFKNSLSVYGDTISKGLAGFLYYLKFADLPVDAKMKLDNKLAKVYKNISSYSAGSTRYKKLQAGRAVVSVFKALGIIVDVWCWISLVGIGFKALTGTQALIKARKILSGASALSTMQRANLLRQITFIRQGAQVRRFGRNTMKFVVNSGNIGRKINATAYLAEKNGMGTINYMLHNIAYGRAKSVATAGNVLRVEGVASSDFFKSSHYIASKHKDIFRINRDLNRASKIGVRELGEGGTVVSYIDKAKMRIFKDYTNDYLKGAGEGEGSVSQVRTLMRGETTLLPREFLYSRKYKEILPFVQNEKFAHTFKIGDKFYAYIREHGGYIFNVKTGQYYDEFVFHPSGYMYNNYLLGWSVPYRPSTGLAVQSRVSNFTQTAINGERNLLGALSLAKNNLSLQPLKPVTISMPNNATGVWGLTKTFVPKISKNIVVSTFTTGNLVNSNFPIQTLGFKLPSPYKPANNLLRGTFSKSVNPLPAPENALVGINEYSKITYKPGEPLEPLPYKYDYDYDTSKPMIAAGMLNDLLEDLQAYAKTHVITGQKALEYDALVKEIYGTLNDYYNLQDNLAIVTKKTALFVEKLPLTVFKGSDISTFVPSHINNDDVFVHDLSKIKDYKEYIAKEIRTLSHSLKEYTVYIEIHGDTQGTLAIDNIRKTSLNEILDIIALNKGDSKVNVISGSCHSGAALSTSLMRNGINVLLISGANDVCTAYDTKLIRINDLRSTYVEAIKNKYYGAYLFYEGKAFNTLIDTKASLPEGNPLGKELNIWRKIYFTKEPLGLKVFDLLSTYPKYQAPKYPFVDLIRFPAPPTIFNMSENLEFFNSYLYNDKQSWKYVINLYDDKWNLIDTKEVAFSEPGGETYGVLVDAVQKELKNNFPDWTYNPVPEEKFSNLPVMPESYDDFLAVSPKGKVKPLKLIPTKQLSGGELLTVEALNNMIESVNGYIKANTLTPKKKSFYALLAKEISELAKDPSNAKINALNALDQKVDMFVAQKPIFVFYGYDFSSVIRPNHIPEEEFFAFDLSNVADYKLEFKKKIELISSIFDEYTIYTQIHGSRAGHLALDKNNKAYILDFVDILDKSRNGSKVNFVSGSCHSGAELDPRLNRPGITLLLISGANDICYTSDIKYVKINDLVTTYFDVVNDKRYGSVLIKDGNIFNSIVLAQKKAIKDENTLLANELNYLYEIFFEKKDVGDGLLNLFGNFEKWKWQVPSIKLDKITKLEDLSFVLRPQNNMLKFQRFLDPPIDLRKKWRYKLKGYDVFGKKITEEEVLFEDANSETHQILVDITQRALKKYFPTWDYKPTDPSAVGYKAVPVSADAFSKESSLSLIPTRKLSEKKALIITRINKNIEKLNELDLNTFTRKQKAVYKELKTDIANIAKDPSKTKFSELKRIERLTNLLNMKKPILLLNGENLDVILPAHISSENFRVVNLFKEKDYAKRIALEIQDFAKVFDKFTVYVDMHGTVEGNLLVSKNETYTRVSEIVRLIEENKGKSKVDLISASCHGGAGFIPSFKESDINILLLSGANEVCYQSDKYFMVYDNLPATYLNAVEAGRYGSYLVYNGKVYNPIKEALAEAKGNETLTQELTTLKDVFINKDMLGTELGKNILKLILNFENYKLNNLLKDGEITVINNEGLKNLPQVPFIFNPFLPENIFGVSHLTKRNGKWSYTFRTFDKNKKIQDVQGASFEELTGETDNFIYEASKQKLSKFIKEDKAPIAPQSNSAAATKPSDFVFIKTPKTLTKFFNGQGMENFIAQRLALNCFEGEKAKYNSVIFDKIQELLQKGVEPKYIDTMIAALKEKGEFSLELYKKALLLHEKYNLPLPVSAYLVNICSERGYFYLNHFAELEKLLAKKFDFSKLANLNMGEIYKSATERPLTQAETSFSILGPDTSKVLATFAKGEGSFDLESWHNFIYLTKGTSDYFSFNYNLQEFLDIREIIQCGFDLIGVEDATKAIQLNKTRYASIFKGLNKNFETENLALLKEKLAPLPFEEKLKIMNALSSSVNKMDKVLDAQSKKELIEKISNPPAFNEAINRLIFSRLNLNYTPELGEIFDFANNNYISQILNAPYHFYVNLSLLYQEIAKNLGKPLKQIFDELPENKSFAKMCAERGINYEAWRGYNPQSSLTRKVLINGGEKPLTRVSMTVRKVDMDNISKALTAGNESSSCRSVGKGECGEYAPNLVRNKMVQQVEMVVDNRPIGNALIYLAEVDGQTSIVVGSIVKRKPYFSYEVTKLVLDYVRQIRDEITDVKIPIYYSNYLTINNYYNYPIRKHDVMLIGDGYNEIFNSFEHKTVMPFKHQKDKVLLFTIEEGPKGPTPTEIADFFKTQKLSDKEAELLTEQCFQGENKKFNSAVLEAQKYLLSKQMEPRFIKSMLESISPEGLFSQELFDKSLELADQYGESVLNASSLVEACLEKGEFNPVIYEKIKFLYENRVPFSKVSFIKSCTVNGVFREDLFNKGLSLQLNFGSMVPQIITDFTNEQGVFKEEYFEAFNDLIQKTKHLFLSEYDAIRDYLFLTEPLQQAFDLLGIKTASEAVISNKDRYLSIYRDLFDVIDKENTVLLKEKLAPLPKEQKLKVITQLAGTINKKSKILNKGGIRNLIEKIPDQTAFEEEINRLVFKQFDFEYVPALAKIFDFSSNKYISLILDGNAPFDLHFKGLFDALKINADKSIHQRFDALPENKAFAKICEENGVNYQAWRGYDPNDIITRNVLMNSGKEPITRENITVRKVDMDNVLKALTSGNESSACRAVGRGACREAAPELVKNKMVQQVEYLYNGKVVGNVLIYLAKVNEELAIVMGSIIKKNSYYVSYEIDKLVIDYVRKIRQDIGRPDIPIYMSTYLKVQNPYNYPMDWNRVTLLGEGEGKIFNSFTHEFEVPARHKTSMVYLYQVDEGIKGTPTPTPPPNPSPKGRPFSFEPASGKNLLQPAENTQNEFLGIPVFKLDVLRNGNHSFGTGFYLKYRNFPFILTAAHVVKDNLLPYITVYNDNGFSMRTKVLNISDKSDLAVLTVLPGKLDFASPWTLALKEPEVGEKLFSVGFPGGREREVNEISLLGRNEPANDNLFYLHDKGTLTFGASGSPLSKDKYSSELFGVVSAIDKTDPVAISVPLPQIKTFLGETIKKIIFTPELNKKYIPLYPNFAKNYANVLEKYDILSGKNPLIKTPKINLQTLNTNFQPAAMKKEYISDVFKDIKSSSTNWNEETAANYLKEHGFSQGDIQEVLKYTNLNKEFDSALFDLFVQGYKIKPDKDFSMVALYYSFKGNIFEYQTYSTIYAIAKKIPQMDFGEIQNFRLASQQELNALFYVADNFPDVNPFEIMNLASSTYTFKSESFNFDNYEKIVSLLKEGISFDAIKKLFKECYVEDEDFIKVIFDENVFNTIDKIAEEAIKRKGMFLSAQNKQFTNADVKDFIYQLAAPVKNALEIVDESTLIAAMGYKMVKFEQFVEAASNLKKYLKTTSKTEDFLEVFYPSKSQKAKDLQAEITALKQQFKTTEGTALNTLKKQINTATKELRTLLEQEKNFSPQEKIEMIEIMSPFSDDVQDLEDLLETAKKIKTEGKEIWDRKIFDLMVSLLGSDYNMKIEDTLHLLQTPYLRHFFVSMYKSVLFREQWDKFLPLLSKKDFSKTLDLLDHNIATREEFKKYALDYEKYTNPKFFPSRSFYDGNNLIEIRQVNMRDVSKSLFLGNESNACTAMGGTHPEYSIPYITHTFVGAIEVLVNGKPVGNSMIFPITKLKEGQSLGDLSSKETALLVDDLKISYPYNKPEYLEGVALLAQDIAKNIGIKNGSVYISKSNTIGYDERSIGSDLGFYLIGKTEEPIWLNAILNTTHAGPTFDYIGALVSAEKVFLTKPKNAKPQTLNTNFQPAALEKKYDFDGFKNIDYTPVKWTEASAIEYLKNKNVNETNTYYIIENCKEDDVFSAELFNLFAKGNQVRPEISFNMMAFNNSFDDNGFNYERYAKIYAIVQKIPSIRIEEAFDYVKAPKEQIDALFNIADNYPNVDPLSVMVLASDTEEALPWEFGAISSMLGRPFFITTKFDFNKYNKITSLLDQGISFASIRKLFKECYVQAENSTRLVFEENIINTIDKAENSSRLVFDENIFNTIDKIANEAVKRKDTFLTVKNKKFGDSDIKDFIYGLAPRITATLKICDEGTLVAAMGYKMLKFEEFVEAASVLKLNLKNTGKLEDFLEVFYPVKSQKAKDLQTEIDALKQQFPNTKGTALIVLKQKINTLTRNLRDLLEQGKKLSPQEKIERIQIMGNFEKDYEFDELIKAAAATNSGTKDVSTWNKKVFELIADVLGGLYNQKLEDALHLTTSPYLPNLFAAIQDENFRGQFYKLVKLINQGDIGASLDKMPHNIATQEKFKKYGLDYEKWTHPSQALNRTFYNGDNLVEIRQVDMRDVSKSLFLGNDSHVCTAIGSFKDQYAIPYITNTMVGAIEILVNGKAVGNSMIMPIIKRIPVVQDGQIVPGAFTKEVAILIDDLKIVAPYDKAGYLKEVTAFVEDIAKNIGIENPKAYISSRASALEDNIVFKYNLLGELSDPIWLDNVSRSIKGGMEEYTGRFFPSLNGADK